MIFGQFSIGVVKDGGHFSEQVAAARAGGTQGSVISPFFFLAGLDSGSHKSPMY